MSNLSGIQSSASSAGRNANQDAYYQRMQQSIQNKAVQKEAAQQKQEQQKTEHKQSTKTQESSLQNQQQGGKDQVKIGRSKWVQTQNGDFEMDPQFKDTMSSSVDLETSGKDILKMMGQKVDVSSKLPKLIQSFKQNVIQSRSHNFFLAKYAGFKVGMLNHLLSTLGVSNEDIQKLQKEALNAAKEENKSLMKDAIYNSILNDIIHGKGRKSRATRRIFQETQTQLIQQMARLGAPEFWTEIRLLEEQIEQSKKVKEEFTKERAALIYQYTYLYQEVSR